MSEATRAPLLPLMLDVTDIPVFVVGNGPSATQRIAMLNEHGARHIHVFAAAPSAQDFQALKPRLVFVADTPLETARETARLAATHGALAHVQDDIPLCRFHLPARLRRGKLLVTVSTDGAAAGFSRLLRDVLAETLLGPEWTGRMEEISAARRSWKEKGLSGQNLFDAIRNLATERGWFRAFSPAHRD